MIASRDDLHLTAYTGHKCNRSKIVSKSNLFHPVNDSLRAVNSLLGLIIQTLFLFFIDYIVPPYYVAPYRLRSELLHDLGGAGKYALRPSVMYPVLLCTSGVSLGGSVQISKPCLKEKGRYIPC